MILNEAQPRQKFRDSAKISNHNFTVYYRSTVVWKLIKLYGTNCWGEKSLYELKLLIYTLIHTPT